jgi:hypothetical protein
MGSSSGLSRPYRFHPEIVALEIVQPEHAGSCSRVDSRRRRATGHRGPELRLWGAQHPFRAQKRLQLDRRCHPRVHRSQRYRMLPASNFTSSFATASARRALPDARMSMSGLVGRPCLSLSYAGLPAPPRSGRRAPSGPPLPPTPGPEPAPTRSTCRSSYSGRADRDDSVPIPPSSAHLDARLGTEAGLPSCGIVHPREIVHPLRPRSFSIPGASTE